VIFNLYHYVVLSLINLISGKRGRGTIAGLLRGGKRRSIYSLKTNSVIALDERYSGVMQKVPNTKILTLFDELLKGGCIEIVEDSIKGQWYPLVYITEKGRNSLTEKEAEFLPKLEKVLEANRTLIGFQKELIPAEKPSQNGGGINEE